jgi:hypothetical protein
VQVTPQTFVRWRPTSASPIGTLISLFGGKPQIARPVIAERSDIVRTGSVVCSEAPSGTWQYRTVFGTDDRPIQRVI